MQLVLDIITEHVLRVLAFDGVLRILDARIQLHLSVHNNHFDLLIDTTRCKLTKVKKVKLGYIIVRSK